MSTVDIRTFQYPNTTSLDTKILINGQPSLRVTVNGGANEADSPYQQIKVGDHIVMTAYIQGGTVGGRAGVDIYANGRVTGIQATNGDPSNWDNSTFIAAGIKGVVIMDFYVQPTYISQGNPNYADGSPITPTGIIAWVQNWDIRMMNDPNFQGTPNGTFCNYAGTLTVSEPLTPPPTPSFQVAIAISPSNGGTINYSDVLGNGGVAIDGRILTLSANAQFNFYAAANDNYIFQKFNLNRREIGHTTVKSFLHKVVSKF